MLHEHTLMIYMEGKPDGQFAQRAAVLLAKEGLLQEGDRISGIFPSNHLWEVVRIDRNAVLVEQINGPPALVYEG